MQVGPNEHSTLLAKNLRARKYNRTGSISSIDAHDMTTEIPSSAVSSVSGSVTGHDTDCCGSPASGSISSLTSSDLDEFNWRRLRFYLVEPMVFILLFSFNLSETVVKNQIIYQTCTTIFLFNETDCRLLGTKNASDYIMNIETIIQPYAARIFMTSSLIESLVPAFCGVFIGTWSDHFGRKPLLVTAYSGFALYYAITAIIAQFSTFCQVNPWYYILAALPLSLVGGRVTYSVAAFCYISDVSSAQERPYRMATYQAALFMGLMTGSFTAGYLYEATNATFVFLTSCCCIFVATCIILCFVPESLNRRRFPLISNSSFISQTTNEMQPTGAQLTEFRKLFDLKAVKEMWNTCFKQRECNDRSIVWLAMIALLISVFVIDGSMMVFYLFIRAKFHWSIKEFTTYETTSTFVSTLGNVIGVIILRKIFKLSIVYLGILAFLSESVGYFTRAFADTNWLMYLSVGLSALKSMAQPMCRTIISNALPANELGTILRNQIIYQACTTVFNYNESICQELGTKNVSEQATKIETEVQPYVANLFMLRTLLESIVPALCGVFIGSWSDHYGRKPLLIISMIGFSFTYIIAAVICEIAIYQPVNPWYYVLAVVPHSILGGNCVFSVAAFCFISDVTDTKTRPYRMIFMEAFFFIGLMGGSLLSSFVYAATGATTTFMISGLLMCGATIFIIIYVPESLHYNRNQEILAATNIKEKQIENIPIDTLSKSVDGKEKRRSELVIDENGKVVEITMGLDGKISLEQENEANKNLSNCEKAKVPEKQKAGAIETGKSKKAGLFSYIHVKDMLVTCFKDRPYYDRSIIWLVTGTMFLSIFVLDGAMTVFYLFVREKFQWSVRDFTFYETVSHMVPMLGALIGFLILRKVFSMSVVTLALLAFFSDILSSIVRGVAYEPWHLYLAVGLGAFKSVGGPMCRTIVSNIVPATDLGKIFSIKNVLQSIAPFMAAPLYTVIYKESLKTFPGLFNIVSAALYSIAFIFLIIVLRFKYSYKEHYASILK